MIPKIILQGGWVMLPILLGSVAALAYSLERCWYFLTIRTNKAGLTGEIYQMVRQGQLAEASEYCKKFSHPIARVLEVGIAHASEELPEVERKMEREGARQIALVEKNLNYLAMVIGVEPLLGFLGTILGLIEAFMAWEKYSTTVTVSVLAQGIYQAMITTAAGLIVAIPYFIIYNIFLGKVSESARDINHYGDEFLSVLRAAKKA